MTKMALFRKKVELTGYGMAISGSVFLKSGQWIEWVPLQTVGGKFRTFPVCQERILMD